MRIQVIFLFLGIIVLGGTGSFAQEKDPLELIKDLSEIPLDNFKELKNGDKERLKKEEKEKVKQALFELLANDLLPENTNLIKKLFQLERVKDSPLEKILDGAKVQLKVFDPKEEGGKSSLGLSYSYAKDIARHEFSPKSAKHSGLVLDFSANGNIAVDRKLNPNDFLDTKLSLFTYQSRGGTSTSSDAEGLWLNAQEDHVADIEDEAELNASPVWEEFSGFILNSLSDQLYWDLSFNGGLESNQSFSTKRYYYGGHFSLIAKGWNSKESMLAKFNILDYPTATIRWLSGVDKKLRPRGSAFPELLVGLDQVFPQDDDPRKLISADDSDFARVKVEASFRTLAGRYRGNNAFLEANFRHYREIAPSRAVRRAELDEFTYFTVGFIVPEANGLFMSYTTGELPFDAKDDQVYEIGFRHNF